MAKNNVAAKKRVGKIAGAFLLVVMMIFGWTAPASAASLAKGTIGSNTAMTLVTDFYDTSGRKHVLTVTAYFGAKTSTSVYIQKIQLCYSASNPPVGIYVRPEISREGGNITNLGVARNMVKGANTPAPCTDWTVNKTYTKASSGEVFRVTNYVVGAGFQLTTIAAYFR